MQEIILKIRYFDKGLSIALKQLTLFFLSNTVPFNELNYQKQQGTRISTDILQVTKQLQKNPLLVIYALSDQVGCNIYTVVFELFQKLYQQIYVSQFMTSQIIPLPFVLLNLESVDRKGKNKNFNILRTKELF